MRCPDQLVCYFAVSSDGLARNLLNGCLAAWANEALRPVYLPFLRARPAILHPSFA